MSNRALLAGVGLGAALAYILDPAGGARRRALVRDKAIRSARLTGRALDATLCDMSNRARGVVASVQGRFSDEPADDVTLQERVRARLGRYTSHPRAIDVDVCDGDVTLCGPVLAHEMDDVVSAAESVHGVRSVTNELEPHETSEGIPSLQGDGHVPGSSIDLFQSHWAPATRAVVGAAALAAAGVAMATYARR